MDWRSTPFSQAVHELAAKLNLAYVLDESVSTELAQTPVRFMADHLTGREALRWLARWVGVEAVVMGETVYSRRPGVCRALGNMISSIPVPARSAAPGGNKPLPAGRTSPGSTPP
jgi:hypothetical protein